MADGWVTQREAAELLGVSATTVTRLVSDGTLPVRRGRRPSIARQDVLDLASARAAAKAEGDERRRARSRGPQPPDAEHDWLLKPAAAAVLGCSVGALGNRVNRGKVPCTVHDGRRWFRLDLLELQVRARAARTVRRVAGGPVRPTSR